MRVYNTHMQMNITTQFNTDNLEPLFDAGNAHSFTFSNFVIDDNDDVTFTVNFPDNLTSADLRDIFRDFQLDELCDFLPDIA